MAYALVIDPRAFLDIQQAIDYYDEKQAGLGEKFERALNKHLLALEKNPFFQASYDSVHCLPIRKFPYMLHYTIDKKDCVVTVRAIFNTSRDPKIWKERK